MKQGWIKSIRQSKGLIFVTQNKKEGFKAFFFILRKQWFKTLAEYRDMRINEILEV